MRSLRPLNPLPSLRWAWSRIQQHFWYKCLGSNAFMVAFFSAYIYLLKHPRGPVTIMPLTVVDHWVGVHPLALPIYLSLWLYVCLPPALMLRRSEVTGYGVRIGLLCLTGLAIFYLWPNAVPPAHIDWAQYPGMTMLKGVDAAGNACPSLHVATAVFACCWLHWLAPTTGFSRAFRRFNFIWCAAIAYSTLATKQHVSIDVFFGALLGGLSAWVMRPRFVYATRPDTASSLAPSLAPEEASMASTSTLGT